MSYIIPKMIKLTPWFILDISSGQVITTATVPSDIKDDKNVILAEIQIPGLNYQPIQSGGLGNRKISFTLDLIKRNSIIGNVNILKQFENLRNQQFSYRSIFSKAIQFQNNPKVVYYWGIGSIPLVWYVSKCNFTHKQHWTNSFGYPQNTSIEMELILDEQNPINRAEEMFRKFASMAGVLEGTADVAQTFANRKAF